jgi:hypothetical protein
MCEKSMGSEPQLVAAVAVGVGLPFVLGAPVRTGILVGWLAGILICALVLVTELLAARTDTRRVQASRDLE